MDIEIVFHPIMTDAKGSRSNIAAKFQNALSVHFLPPIGVFWDIENCQVPKGKSAIALVQNIREKFFSNHREAEFMCVCDINKESKTVIQELILAQVTVVHISATSKNAADDKLKQCMRRFVDTHGAPSTLLLISDDVNFSSDLSDFRHRHNIHIILIHRGRAHQSLLTCAHEHYAFSTIACDLPSRSPTKSSGQQRPNALIVTNLPPNRNAAQIKTQLKKLSQNCGGKVSEIKGNKAYVKFATRDYAERAQKRMDKEVIYGTEISVNFCHNADCDFSASPSKRTKDSNSSNETSESSSCSRDSSTSPIREIEESEVDNQSHKKFNFPPPPVLDSQTFPSMFKNNSFKEFHPVKSSQISTLFPAPPNMEIIKEAKNFQLDWNHSRAFNNASTKNSDISAFSPFKKEVDSRVKYTQKNVGRVSPFVMQDYDKNAQSSLCDSSNQKRVNSQVGSNSSTFLFSNQGYQNSVQNSDTSFEIPRINNDPFFYSSAWSSAAMVSESTLSVSRGNSSDNSSSIELHVSNLDPTYDVNDMKKILLSVFREHVMVLHISMCLQPDGSAKATVKVPSLQDAQYAISRLHRRKIGHKRILISYVASDKNPPFHILKSETISLLNDIPNKSLPLIKFRELYEKRYHRPIPVSELYKMREAVTIQGDSGSRIVYLNAEYCNTPSLPDSEDSQECNNIERPYCEVHYHVSASQGWADQYTICPLPLVHISLKALATAVHTLLDSHQGSLPLISFCDCYEAEIGPLPVVVSFISNREESFEVSSDANQTGASKDPKGVPLEHLIACIAGVEVAKSVLCIKKVQWLENRIDNQTLQNFSPALMGQLTLFGREVMDLLKSQPQCLVQFNKFIPTYHHHFGRQCRVADYGFTKLIDLLEAMPHIVQVLGEGQNRQVTLTHRTQIKRFAAELLRILKSRASKQITVSEFPLAYEQVIEKPFEITNYGVCEIEDMLDEVSENVIVTSNSGSEIIISIPKREQTPEEIEHTKQFAEEVVELMKHTPNCSMAFNKFIPSYHHHFGKQCRVADYGFTKLIELFEAIPSVLEVTGSGEDKILKLVESEQHKILSDRLITVLKAQPNEMVEITQLCSAYAQVHGHALRPLEFGFADLNELLQKLHLIFKIIFRSKRPYVCLVDHELVHQISLNIRRLLMEDKDGRMSIADLCKLYQIRFGPNTDLPSYFRDMTDVIQFNDAYVQLTPLQLLARKLILLLQDNCGQVPFASLGSLFLQKYGINLCVADYGFSKMNAVVEHFTDYFIIKGKKHKRVVYLVPEVAGNPLPEYQILPQVVKKTSSFDILNEPVPSCIPSPNIEPHVKDRWEDLIGFETPPVQDILYISEPLLSEEENTIATVQDTIRTSDTFMASTAVKNESPFIFSRCSSSATLSYVVPSFEVCNEDSMHFSQISLKHHESPTFLKKAKIPISSVIEISKNTSKLESKQFENNHINSSGELSEDSVSDQSTSRSSINSQAFKNSLKDISHTKDGTCSTSRNEIRQLSRRKRIAAQFSSPMDE